MTSGFIPCTATGGFLSDDSPEWFLSLFEPLHYYRCGACGRIIERSSQRIIGLRIDRANSDYIVIAPVAAETKP